jgi:hypothetical protein
MIGRSTWAELATLTVGTALALTGCSGSSPTASADPSSTAPVVASSTATSPPATSSAPAPSPSTSAPTSVQQVVTVGVARGKVTGPKGRVKVKKGSTVQLVVSSDIADEVHLHGYDKHTDVDAGGTVALTFKATIGGVFEVELEKKKLRLLLLQVS